MTSYRPAIGPLSVRGCVAEIDVEALVSNLEVARRRAAGAEVLCVVKANAYGHGSRLVSRALFAAGARRFGVAFIEEGLELREAGVLGTILVLGGAAWWRSPALLVEAELTPVLSSPEEIEALAHHLEGTGKTVCAHVKLDTGMARIGVPVGDDAERDLAPFLAAAQRHPEVRVTGACTHFANADLADLERSKRQVQRFEEAVAVLLAAGLPLEVAHVANSAASLEGLLEATAQVATPGLKSWHRPGLLLYGVSPFPDRRHQEELRPVLSWRAPVVARKRVPRGTQVSYGGTYTTERDSELAVLGVGYADGYLRSVSGQGGEVLLAGRRAPLRGRVCMDLMVVDVTDIVDELGAGAASLGALATLLGPDGDERIDAWQLAGWAGTIPYEVLNAIAARVPRAAASAAPLGGRA